MKKPLARAKPRGIHQQIAALNPLAWWRYEETSGTVAANEGTGSAVLNGTYAGTVNLGLSARVGKAWRNVSAGRVLIVGGATLSLPSFSLWGVANLNVPTTTARLADKGADWLWYLDTVFRLVFYVRCATQNVTITTVGFCPLGRWASFAVTFDEATTQAQIYINGVAQPVTGAPGGGSRLPDSSDLHVGASATGTQPTLGMFDEMALWDRALAPDEIMRLHHGVF